MSGCAWFPCIRGLVLDDRGHPAPRAAIRLLSPDEFGFPDAQTESAIHGSFDLMARAGEWRLSAEQTAGAVTLRGFSTARVAGRDVDRLTVRLWPPFTLEGRVEREQPRDSEGNRKLTAVSLSPVAGEWGQTTTAFHEQDGRLRITGVYPGRYTILPLGFVPTYYLASTLLGEREVLGKEVEILDGSARLTVIYKPNAARVRGVVEKGEGATVVLVPQDEALINDQFIRQAACAPGGRFEIGSLRPGDYYALHSIE